MPEEETDPPRVEACQPEKFGQVSCSSLPRKWFPRKPLSWEYVQESPGLSDPLGPGQVLLQVQGIFMPAGCHPTYLWMAFGPLGRKLGCFPFLLYL